MKEYIVTVEFQMMGGASHLTNTFYMICDSMKEAKENAKLLVSGNVLNVKAHKVKEGETVPEEYMYWMYK